MSFSSVAASAPPIRTTPEKWLPKSHVFRRWFRGFVNKNCPEFRQQVSYMSLDGPLPKHYPEETVLHGLTLHDNFKYMEDLYDKRTLNYVKMEDNHNYYVDGRMDTQAMKHRVWQELDGRSVTTTREGGFDKGEERIGDFIYYTRSLEGEAVDIGFYRKRPGQADVLGEELINPHELRRQFGYQHCNIGICRVSYDGAYLAYTLSVEGGDRYICHIRSIDNASTFHVIRSSNIVSIEFGTNNMFFYTECNELNRPDRVMAQEIRPGILPPPTELYRDDDETFFVDVRKTKDSEFLVISSDSKNAGNVMVLPASYPKIPKQLEPFFPAKKAVEIANKDAWGWLEHHNGHFLMVTSKEAANFKVVYARDEVVLRHGASYTGWKDLVPHRDDVQITDVDIFKTHICVFENVFGFERSAQIRIIDIRKNVAQERRPENDAVLHFPPLTCLTPGLNKNYEQDTINFVFSSIVQPSRECVYNFNSGYDQQQCKMMAPMTLYTQRQHESLTPNDYMWPYTMFRDTVVGHDGVEIPITICQKRDLFVEEITDYDPVANTPRPCLVYVYGSYGEVPSLHFQLAPYLWLIRRRWTVAFAHVRGGGELPGWAEEGKGEKKENTVKDFISCVKYMQDQGYTTPEQTVVAGNSAGTVPIAAAANMYGRDLFNMALLRSPFLDIINTMCDPDLPLSLAEREDWGDPLNSKQDLETLLKYDPYQNINDNIVYPSMVVSTCLDDDRVPSWNALKYVARLREVRSKQNVDPIADPLVLRVKSTGGHYHWNEILQVCEELSFIMQHYDMPGVHCRYDDMDVMTQMDNYFKTGMMDHDDAQQTFLKWDNWEREKIDFVSKMHSMTHEPNFRALKAKKETYYWDMQNTQHAPAGMPADSP